MEDLRCQAISEDSLREAQRRLRAETPGTILLTSSPVEDLQNNLVLDPANKILADNGHQQKGPAGDAQDAFNSNLMRAGEKWFTAWKGKVIGAVQSHRGQRLDLVAIKGGPMCDKERDFLSSKYFYGMCTNFGNFEMNVCIVMLENVEELQSWLDNPTEAADLLAEVWRLLGEAEGQLAEAKASFQLRSQSEREDIHRAETTLGPESAKGDAVARAEQRLRRRQVFLQEVGGDAYPEDAWLLQRDQERVSAAARDLHDHNMGMKELEGRRKRLEEDADVLTDLEGRLRNCRDNLEKTSKMRALDPGDAPDIKGKINDLKKAKEEMDAHNAKECEKAKRRQKTRGTRQMMPFVVALALAVCWAVFGQMTSVVALAIAVCWAIFGQIDPQKNAKAWYDLGVNGGGTVGGRAYTKKQCWEKALQIDPEHAQAWPSLGLEGGGTVGGRAYTRKQCYERAAEVAAAR